MSFTDPLAQAIVEIEPVVNTGAFNRAATQAAENFDRVVNQSFQRGSDRIRTAMTNATAGVRTLGQVIAARLPAQVTQAANAIVTRFGQAFGTVRAGVNQLSSAFNSAFNSISSGAIAAAAGIATIVAITAKVASGFAKTADDFHRAELSIRAIITAQGGAADSADHLISRLRELGSGLGFSSTQSLEASQKFLALGFTVDETAGLMESVTIAAARTSASEAALSRTIDGLTQIASKNTLQMEELRRQILGNIPGGLDLARVFEIIGEKLGISAEQARKLQEEGKITSAVAIPAIKQAFDEMNGSVDVFAIRAQTLSGLLGILRENFNQIVATSFKPFIEALVPTLKEFVDGIKSGTGPFGQLSKQISDFGKVVGNSLSKILQEIIPLLPSLLAMFVSLTKAVAPLVVEAVKLGASIGKVVIPVITVLANVLEFLFTKLGPLSSLFRQLALGTTIGGAIKAFGLFGRAVGSAGGLIGRLATPLSKILEPLAALAPVIAAAVAALGILKGPIEAIIGVLGTAIEKLQQFVGFLSRLPGIKQAVGLIGDVKDSVLGLFDSADKVGKVFQVIPKPVKEFAKTAEEAFTDLNKAFTDALDSSNKLQDAQDAVEAALDKVVDAKNRVKEATERVTEAQLRETEAREKLTEVNTELAEAEAERLKLIQDTTRDIRELQDAEDKLAGIGLKLLNIDLERADILAKIAELQDPAAHARAVEQADLDIAQAKNELNQAIRDEQKLLEELNEDQRESVDLTGLSLDQLRTSLANIRASLAAQRARKKDTKDERDLDLEKQEAALNVHEAQLALNELIVKRQELDEEVIEDQREIERLQINLKQLEIDKRELIRDQGVAQDELNTIRSGETEKAKEIKKLDEEIRNLKREQRDASRDIETAVKAVRDAEDQIKPAVEEIKNAEKEVALAKADQKLTTAEILGTEREINAALRERIGLNTDLGRQTSQLLAQSLVTNFLPSLSRIDQVLFESFVGVGRNDPSFIKRLTDMILSNPNRLRDLLRSVGVTGFEQGGLITKPTFANMGEKFKHEMVLPLTKPDRVWTLLSQNLPRYPGALRAAQEAISPPLPMPSLSQAVSSGRRVQNRADGPATYGQFQELINLLKEPKTEVHVDAPITVNDQTGIPAHMLRKLKRDLERDILDKLRR